LFIARITIFLGTGEFPYFGPTKSGRAQRNAEVQWSRSRDAALDFERCRGRGRGVARNLK
jgi:hypothetical protein